MGTREATPRLRQAVEAAVESKGLTWREINQRGGPSPATMTKLLSGALMRVTPGTCRKLDQALGWSEGVAWGLCDGEPAAVDDLEKELDRIVAEARVLLERLRDAEAKGRAAVPRPRPRG